MWVDSMENSEVKPNLIAVVTFGTMTETMTPKGC